MTRLFVLVIALAPVTVRAEQVPFELSVAGTTVTVDGREVKRGAPVRFSLDLPAGERELVFTKDGYEPSRVIVRVKAGDNPTVGVLLVQPKGDRKRVLQVAVALLQGTGDVNVRAAAIVTEALTAEIRKLEGVRAIGMNEVQDLLGFSQAQQTVGCDTSACVAELGGALGVDELVTGSVGGLGTSTVINLRRTDLKSATVAGTFTQSFDSVGGDEFLGAIGAAVEKLFPGAKTKQGVERGVDVAYARRLNPPPVPVIAFGSVAAVTLVTGLAAAGFGIANRLAVAEFDAGVRAGVSVTEYRALESNVGRTGTAANGLAIGALAGAVGTVVLALLTDWNGDGADLSERAAIEVQPNALRLAWRF